MITGGYEIVNKRFINEINKAIIFDTLDFPPKERESSILNHNSIGNCLIMAGDQELVDKLKSTDEIWKKRWSAVVCQNCTNSCLDLTNSTFSYCLTCDSLFCE